MKFPYPLKRTRVKICGFTRQEDALAAVGLGVDAIGLVFYAPSPRNVSIEQAQGIVRGLPPFVTTVGLFVDAEPQWIVDVLGHVPLNLLQFHGDEEAGFCAAFARPYIKAIRMKPETELSRVAAEYSGAAGLLLDADDPVAKGGTGTRFDWSLVQSGCRLPLVLAGGLTPENVGAAIRQVKPYAVDVSSGVESAKGIKDQEKMAAFLNEVHL